jgi:Tfp pilus assembly protein PilO
MERTSTEKLWLIGAALVAFVIVVIGYFFFISPQRDQTVQVGEQITTAQLENQTLQSRIGALASQNKKLATYQQTLQKAELALPATSSMPDFLRTLQSIGNATSTTFTSLTVGIPEALVAPAAVAPTSGQTSSAPTTSGTTAPAAASIYSIPITTTVTGTPAQLSEFLTQLQSVQPRAVLITLITQGATSPNATTTSKGGGGQSNLSLTMEAFVAPAANAAAPTATPTAGP